MISCITCFLLATCMQNLIILTLSVPDILFWASKLKVGHAILTTPRLMAICYSYAGTLHQKTRVLGLSYGIVCVMLRLAVLVHYRHVSDG